ncbi:hypothetical protein DFP97_12253 [Paenibacillus prosopidis]|uniref:Uncharacterized protein n=1 Tax=Paenibacillus prosopidis TaxID=630520 RepID=A0A368VQQ7_9BACL|nr:hypothetical protein DFP97_12253 [Paenibacillus prosopidis]
MGNKKSPNFGLLGILRLLVFHRNAKEEKKPYGIYGVLGARALEPVIRLGFPIERAGGSNEIYLSISEP